MSPPAVVQNAVRVAAAVAVPVSVHVVVLAILSVADALQVAGTAIVADNDVSDPVVVVVAAAAAVTVAAVARVDIAADVVPCPADGNHQLREVVIHLHCAIVG